MQPRNLAPVIGLLLGAGLLAGSGTPANATEAVSASCTGTAGFFPFTVPPIIFEGVAIARAGGVRRDRFLLSPATFRVTRYLKGEGPRRIRVRTSLTRPSQYAIAASGGEWFFPRVGERWRLTVYRDSKGSVYHFAPCDGGQFLH